MNNPVTVRMTPKELKLLRKVTKAKTTSKGFRKLLYEEAERQQQDELFRKIRGKMKLSDFDDRLI